MGHHNALLTDFEIKNMGETENTIIASKIHHKDWDKGVCEDFMFLLHSAIPNYVVGEKISEWLVIQDYITKWESNGERWNAE